MSDGTPTPPNSNPPKVEITNASPGVVAGGMTAENYVSGELQKARTNLQRTQIGGGVLLLLLGGWLIYITSRFTSQLQPDSAAEITEGLVMQQISDKGPDLQTQLKQKIPEIIAQAPDYALKQLPDYRQSLETRIKDDLKKYCDNIAPQMGAQLDTFLDQNKDQVHQLITDANDPSKAKQIGVELRDTFLKAMDEPTGGESVRTKIDAALASLHDVEKRMTHLADGKNLTPEEKKTRHAIAVLTQAINTHAGSIRDTVAPAVQDAVAPLANKATGAMAPPSDGTDASESPATGGATHRLKPGPDDAHSAPSGAHAPPTGAAPPASAGMSSNPGIPNIPHPAGADVPTNKKP